jgi:hypothetical protein
MENTMKMDEISWFIPRDKQIIETWFKVAGIEMSKDEFANDLMLRGMVYWSVNGWESNKETIARFYNRLRSNNVSEA